MEGSKEEEKEEEILNTEIGMKLEGIEEELT